MASLPQARLRSMVNRYSEMVARTLLTSGVPQSDVEDEVQRTFMAAARRLDDVQPGSERGFLYRVARHTAAHAHRTRKRHPEVPSGELPDVPNRSEAFASPESLALHRQLWTLVASALDRMGESLRAVFVHDLEGMPRNEIALLLNVPEGTVASRLRLARKQIRTLIRVRA
jgi:RNA polymerase sigma-70 factor (ECF subfamily)